MTSSTHLVAPEDLMAFLDGELSPAEVQSVSAHLENCAECAALARDLRGVSQSLSQWDVPPMPGKLEESVIESASAAGILNRSTKAARVLRPRSRRWKWWLIGGGAAFAALALYTVPAPRYRKSIVSHQYALSEQSTGPTAMVYDQMGQSAKADRFSGGGLEQLGKSDTNGRVLASEPLDRRQAKSTRAGVVGGLSGYAYNAAPQPALMIARTANLTIIVKDIVASRSALEAILARHQGYPAQMNVSTPQNGQHQIQASLRIPAPVLDATLADLKTLGRVENESQSGEEVIEQHQDLEARLKTARETETRYQSILQQRTGTISDVLEVQQSIAQVRGQIEQMEVDEKNLDHRVDFASVELNLSEEYKASLASPGDSTGTQMHNAFVTGYHNANGTILGVVLFVEEYGPATLIWITILGVPIILLRRRYRRLRSDL